MKHLVIPDTQVKPGISLDYLRWIGQYAVEKKPDVIVMIGDFADMPSLSSYDVGKKSFEGRTYQADIRAAIKGMDTLLAPMRALNKRLARAKKKQYKPKMVLTMGNHEQRIKTAIEYDRKLEGLISFEDLEYEKAGWTVYPFLDVVTINGVAYSHYFASGVMGRPITSANALLTKKHMSCFAGHQQGRQIAYGRRADGTEMTTIIAGSAYLHDEDYLSKQTNQHWRGIYMLHDVKDGSFDEMAVSMKYLKEQFA
jgi:predicted MPP superfamily phosphohydrolase|tara:strand:+ start:4618 stop:5379 length:762 start_codon:yes stop_codon:yes gene_type:complete